MKIDVFNVGHGGCSVITLPDGKRIMIDCGTRTDIHWWPSIHYYGQRIEALILSNLDEDHVHDFIDVMKNLEVGTVWLNPTISALNLISMKPDGMQDGIRAVTQYLQQPIGMNRMFNFYPASVISFYAFYGVFKDTNNLSLATFVQYGPFCILFAGDLEVAGWKALLTVPTFAGYLRRVNIFITSHHGRTNGCCEELFSMCKPFAFIVSDKSIVHDTQKTNEWYRRRAIGMPKIITNFLCDETETRYVFTTRNDGCMTINVEPTGTFRLQTNSIDQDILSKILRPRPRAIRAF